MAKNAFFNQKSQKMKKKSKNFPEQKVKLVTFSQNKSLT